MESGEDEEIISILTNMFPTCTTEVIDAVLESCNGDLNLSIDAMMTIADNECPNDAGMDNNQQNEASSSQQTQPLTSYASTAQTPGTGAIPKQINRTTQQTTQQIYHFWTDQIRAIIANHNRGYRVMIIMRGAPGSGKSYLAKQLVEMMIGTTLLNYRTHIFSTDDFFSVRGQYQFNKHHLSEAHTWNQNRVQLALIQGLSPLIVDNTNIYTWEMEPYVKFGVANGYIIEVVEPNTSWAKKPGQLFRKNIHNVPIVTIKRMIENYCEGITGESIRRSLGLSYPGNMVPPVQRLIPAVIQDQQLVLSSNGFAREDVNNVSIRTDNQLESSNVSAVHSQVNVLEKSGEHTEHNSNVSVGIASNIVSEMAGPDKKKNEINVENSNEMIDRDKLKQKIIMEAQERLEEIEKVEIEWENGDNWDDDKQGEAAASSSEQNLPKPQRTGIAELEQQCAKSLRMPLNDSYDWSQIAMFMPPWNDKKESVPTVERVTLQKHTATSSTAIESGDTDVHGKNRVISATSRNINEFYMSIDKEKIPEKVMLDKSTMTYEHDVLTENVRCKNEEKHFIALRKLFKNIAHTELRDIFDKCYGDVNWAVEIVLDGMVNQQFKTVDTEELSDSEDQNIEQCECLSVYDIIPDVGAARAAVSTPATVTTQEASTVSPTPQRKSKKDTSISEESALIKRQIEQNVVISDNHYSEHCLKIRKLRRGEYDSAVPSTSATPDVAPILESNETNITYSDDDSDSGANDSDKIVTIMLSKDTIAEIDRLCGRKDMEYPDFIVPRISIPLSTLNLINAVWMESVMDQIEVQSKQSAMMIKQDEEFARQLANKEAELVMEGKEPAVPDFKEIMDLDFAVALYQKDVSEWRNNMPNDMAGKMSRDKLHNLFPDIEQDTLSELLVAHDNNFLSTVEVLLISVGRGDILEQENGVNKFVMEGELQRQDNILKKEMKVLTEEEWPLLPKEDLDMATVNKYREVANRHLIERDKKYNKAEEYMRRGMTQVASQYSFSAAIHKQMYEQANSKAVATLIQINALKSPDNDTIDLHFLHVKESLETANLFIDAHIQKLKDSQSVGGARVKNLFFITGRGLHSPGRPRIKPALKKHLNNRGLWYRESNPGLLAAKVSADSKLSYQIALE